MSDPSDGSLVRLVYTSAATREMGQDELEELLTRARERNAACGVTGMLLYHDGSFLQALEGEREIVDALFERIEEDPRHTQAAVLLRTEVDERVFDSWSMGFFRARDRDDLPGLSDFLRSGLQGDAADAPEAAWKLLSGFREGRWRRRVDAGA